VETTPDATRLWSSRDVCAASEAEFQRLERPVWKAVYALEKAGLDRKSV
jgi:hypothetical protein